MKPFHWMCLPVFLSSAVLIGCRTGSESAKEKTYDVKGAVVSMDLQKPSVKLDHQDIPGLMKAHVMELDVASPKILEGLKPGDKVQGKLKVSDETYTITHLEKSP